MEIGSPSRLGGLEVFERYALKGPRKGRRDVHRAGDSVRLEVGADLVERLIGKGESVGRSTVGGVDQELRPLRIEVGVGCAVIKTAVKDLDHNIGAIEIGEPVAKNILREGPSADPSVLEILRHPFRDLGSIKLNTFVSLQGVVSCGERPSRYRRNEIDPIEEPARFQLQHHPGREIGGAASPAGEGEADKHAVLPFFLFNEAIRVGLRDRTFLGPGVTVGAPATR